MRRHGFHHVLWAVLVALSSGACAEETGMKHIRDVIYARQQGIVLTMDVFQPAKPSGIGVLFMVSGGWVSSHDAIHDAIALPFVARGQTVFAVVHGSQPKYTIPEIVEQVERATRFVRFHAKEYGVDPDRLGIAGGSAGGHLSLMQGARGRPGDPNAKDPIDRVSSKVQAVACFFPPTDFLNYGEPGVNAIALEKLKPFRAAFGAKSDDPAELARAARETSPITYVTAAMPPTLIIHGDRDELVPIQQARLFIRRLEELKVPCQLVVREGQGHGWATMFQDATLLAEWFDRHLGGAQK